MAARTGHCAVADEMFISERKPAASMFSPTVSNGSGYWQGRSSGLPRMRAIRSVEERNVAGRYIHHVNAQSVQCFQNRLHPWPESAELLSLLQFPFGPRLIREIRRRDQPGSCEIQDEWARDDTHLDDAQLVVETNELRDIESQNLAGARVPQPFVHLALAEIRPDGTMHFEGRFTGCGLAFSHEDDTVNSEAQPLGELKLMLRRVGLSVLDENFFHVGTIESGRALRPSENAAADKRRLHPR